MPATTMNTILFCSNVNVSEHFLATLQIFLYSKTHDKKKLKSYARTQFCDSRHWEKLGKQKLDKSTSLSIDQRSSNCVMQAVATCHKKFDHPQCHSLAKY